MKERSSKVDIGEANQNPSLPPPLVILSCTRKTVSPVGGWKMGRQSTEVQKPEGNTRSQGTTLVKVLIFCTWPIVDCVTWTILDKVRGL